MLITRYDAQRAKRGEMVDIQDVLDILSTALLGVVPESQDVLRASNIGSPRHVRLQVLLSHERTMGGSSDLLAILHEEILAAMTKQVAAEPENVRMRFDRRPTA
jgi:septum formation inhibitor-activating ATPase MinD